MSHAILEIHTKACYIFFAAINHLIMMLNFKIYVCKNTHTQRSATKVAPILAGQIYKKVILYIIIFFLLSFYDIRLIFFSLFLDVKPAKFETTFVADLCNLIINFFGMWMMLHKCKMERFEITPSYSTI